MSEETFIHHCSPTMAGIKTANLFSCCFADDREMRDSIRRLNGILVKKGIRVLPLRYHDRRALIYAYRPSLDCSLATRRKMCTALLKIKLVGINAWENGRSTGMKIRQGRLLQSTGNAPKFTVRSMHRAGLWNSSQ